MHSQRSGRREFYLQCCHSEFTSTAHWSWTTSWKKARVQGAREIILSSDSRYVAPPPQRRIAGTVCITWLAALWYIQICGKAHERKRTSPGGIQIARLFNQIMRQFPRKRSTWLWTFLPLFVPFSLFFSGCCMKLAMGKLPMNKTTVDTKNNYFLALAPLYGQWIMKSCDPSGVLRPR